MSDISHTVIGKFDGDYGTHCNSCPSIATFKITLRNTSFRLCESCSYELFEQMDFRYRRSKLATLTALLKEAGEALEENDDILRGLANNHHFQMVGAGNKHHSENFSECQASTCKAALKQIRRAAEIRKKIQEVFP